MRIFKAIWAYLKDWKNLLTHGLIGAAILCAALFLPIKPFSRILILVVVIAFNLVRMRLDRKRKAARTSAVSQRNAYPISKDATGSTGVSVGHGENSQETFGATPGADEEVNTATL